MPAPKIMLDLLAYTNTVAGTELDPHPEDRGPW